MFKDSLKESIVVKQKLLEDEIFWQDLEKSAGLIGKVLSAGGKILIAGNGGSAAAAQHFAAEIVATLHKEKRKGYPAIALHENTSFLTAWINDFGPDGIFARQVEAFGQPGDILFGISTSGNSKNVILAAGQAKASGLRTIGLLGNNGGQLKNECDIALTVPSSVTARIQEVHITIIHMLCEKIVPELK